MDDPLDCDWGDTGGDTELAPDHEILRQFVGDDDEGDSNE